MKYILSVVIFLVAGFVNAADLHYAKLDANDVVENVVVIDPSRINPGQWLKDRIGGDWVRVPQKNAGSGFKYIRPTGKFRPPQPFQSWSWVENRDQWEAPVASPTDHPNDPTWYRWDENTLSWVR